MDKKIQKTIRSMTHHAPDKQQLEKIRILRVNYQQLVQIVGMQKDTKYRDIALKELESSLLWAIKGVILE